MVRCACFLIALGALLVSRDVQAQQQGQIPQVVQLPTFSFFSVSTTVSVPDSGAAYLGGVRTSRRQSSTRGVPGLAQLPYAGRLFKNRGIAASTTSSGAHVTATIIDHGELDRLVLSEAAALRGAPLELTATGRKASFLSSHVGRHDHTALATSRETPTKKNAINPQLSIAAAQQETEKQVAMYLDRAQRAERAGNVGSAKCSYRVVSRRGTPAQRQYALARLVAIEAADKGISLAATER